MSKTELIDKYKAEKVRLGLVEKALEIQKGRLNLICKELFEGHGKGPHDIGDGHPEGYMVMQRGETFYLQAAKKKGAKETTAEAS
jgi:hypothetical protein